MKLKRGTLPFGAGLMLIVVVAPYFTYPDRWLVLGAGSLLVVLGLVL